MLITVLQYAFAFFLITYFLSFVISLLYIQKSKAANIFSNTLSIISSLGIGFVSIVKLILLPYTEIHFTLSTSFDFLSISFFIDNFSAFFMLLISILLLFVSLYSYGYLVRYYYRHNASVLCCLFHFLNVTMLLVITAGQWFYWLLLWEIMSLVSCFILLYQHDIHDTKKAGIRYIITSQVGTSFLLAAFALLYSRTGTWKLDISAGAGLPEGARNMIFILLVLGFGIHAGIFPFHRWVPSLHGTTPHNTAAILAGAANYTAVYGLIRALWSIGGVVPGWWGISLSIIGSVSMIIGIVYAFLQSDVQKSIAFTGMENIGGAFTAIGLSLCARSVGNDAVAVLCMGTSLMIIFNHAIYKCLLFLGAGAVYYATRTNSMKQLGGLIRRMPWTALFFLAAALSASALPPFGGFISRWMMYQSILINLPLADNSTKIMFILLAAAFAITSTIGAACYIRLFGTVFLGQPRTLEAREGKEVPHNMIGAMGVLAGGCLLTGIFPQWILGGIDRITLPWFGSPAASSNPSFSGILFHGLKAERSNIAPVILATAVFMCTGILFLWLKAGKGRMYDENYTKLAPRMQYSAESIAIPFYGVISSFVIVCKRWREFFFTAIQKPIMFRYKKFQRCVHVWGLYICLILTMAVLITMLIYSVNA